MQFISTNSRSASGLVLALVAASALVACGASATDASNETDAGTNPEEVKPEVYSKDDVLAAVDRLPAFETGRWEVKIWSSKGGGRERMIEFSDRREKEIKEEIVSFVFPELINLNLIDPVEEACTVRKLDVTSAYSNAEYDCAVRVSAGPSGDTYESQGYAVSATFTSTSFTSKWTRTSPSGLMEVEIEGTHRE